jgi:hypothetical protein
MVIRRRGVLILAVAALAAAGAIPLGGVASATEPTGQCNVGQFPVVDGSASNLKVNCTVQPASPGTGVNVERIQDFDNVQWHNGAGHEIVADITSGSTAVTFVPGAANGLLLGAADTNKTITGLISGDIPPADFVVSENVGGNSLVLAIAATKTVTNAKLLVENGPGRSVADAILTNGSNVVNSATANFVAGDVGFNLDASDLPQGTTITAVNSLTKVHVSASASATATADCASGCSASIDANPTTETANPTTTARMVGDVHTTKLSTTITSASANFQQSDVGLVIVEKSDIAANARIASVTNATTAVMSAAASKTATSGQTFIGLPSATAPLDGDYVSQLATSLIENPGLVSGARPCSENTPTGALLNGSWENPNTKGFALTGHPGLDFSGTDIGLLDHPAIAQILYATPVVSFAAYVDQTPGNTYSSNPHIEIVYPFLPTALGTCPNTGNAASYSYIGETTGQSKFATGFGRPGTTGVRAVNSFEAGTGPVTGTANVQGYDWDGTVGDAPTLAFTSSNSTCTITRPADIASLGTSFPCGLG